MELIVANVVIPLLKAAAGAIGQQLGSRLIAVIWPKFEASGQQQALSAVIQGQATSATEHHVQQQIAAAMTTDPVFKSTVINAVNAEYRQNPNLAQLFASIPQHMFGLSPEQAKAQTGRCPVGGEILMFPQYLNADGTVIPGGTFKSFTQLPRTALAQCNRGHTWPVFQLQV